MLKVEKKYPEKKACLSARRGFTLIEIMLVVALIVIIGGVSVPVYQTFQVKNDLDVATYTIAQTLRRAQVLAQAGEEDSVWGVHLESGKIILFKGANFATREQASDELFEISGDFNLTGISEITYAKLSGQPQPVGNITLSTSTGETRTLNINTKGMLDY